MAIVLKRNPSFQKENGIACHESVLCWILINNVSILIGGVYRRPGAPDDYLVQLQNFLHGCVNERTKVILTGDFIMPGIDWGSFAGEKTEVKGSDILYDILFDCSLTQLVTKPTCVQGSSCSVLNLAFVSSSLAPKISIEEGSSDHNLILLIFHGLGSRVSHAVLTTRISVKNYSKANDESVIDFFEALQDDFLNKSSGVLWQKLKNLVAHCESTIVPSRFKKTDRKTPWIMRSLIHLKRKVQRMCKNKNLSFLFNVLSRQLKTQIRTARENFFFKHIERLYDKSTAQILEIFIRTR